MAGDQAPITGRLCAPTDNFTVSRHRDGPLLFLECFTGGLLADCYAGYDAVQAASDSRIVRAACVTHARRKVFEARSNHPVHASVLLAMFKELYDIEDRGKQLPSADRLALRQAESRPIWERMREYIASDAVGNVMPKEPFGQALTYLGNQFDHLLVHLDDGLMPIDSNDAEPRCVPRDRGPLLLRPVDDRGASLHRRSAQTSGPCRWERLPCDGGGTR
jgi:transposase